MAWIWEDRATKRLQLRGDACRWTCAVAVLLSASAAKSDVPVPASVGAAWFECVIEPQQTVKLAPPVVGVIARLEVDRGDVVHRGQIVGKLEDGVEAAALA